MTTTRREYLVGQVIELAVLITDPNNEDAPIDDASAAVVVYLPDGTNTAPTPIAHGDTGEYTALYTPTLAGYHEYIWTATTLAAGKGKGHFYVSAL